jgi:Protein of unknown function (DUF3306)
MSDESADGFLARWSRRKRAAVRAPEAPAAAALDGPVVGLAPVPVAEEATPAATVADDAASPPAEQPAFDPASLPAPESLTAASDITGFLRAEVPAALRRAALRRIWTLDPGIRDFIGPADYAWDYNAPDGVPGFALGLGGDVQKLLAQAMGWHTEASPEATPEPEPAADLPAVATSPPPDPERNDATEPEPARLLATAADPAPATARRHGGARPD